MWKDQKLAAELVSRLLDARMDGGGFPVDFRTNHLFRCLSGVSNLSLTDFETLKALEVMSKNNIEGMEDFERIFKANRQSSLSNQKEWLVIFPIYTIIDHTVTLPCSFTINGLQFRLTTWRRSQRLLEKSGLDRTISLQKTCKFPLYTGICATVKLKSHTHRAAWDKVSISLDVFRGILDFMNSATQISLSSPPKPLTKFPYPGWAAILAGNQKEMLYFLAERNEKIDGAFNQETIKALRVYLRRFRHKSQKNSFTDLLADWFRLYSQAVDELTPSNVLVAWWQLAESLTLSRNFNGDTATVCKRLSFYGEMFKMPTPGIEYCLNGIAEKRNRSVHKGIYSDISQDDCNYLKTYCEQAIFWLIENSKFIKDARTLENIYKVLAQDSIGFESLNSAVKFVKKIGIANQGL